MLNSPTIADLAEFIRSHSKETKLTPAETKPAPVLSSKTSSNAMLIAYGGGKTGPLRVVFHAALGTMNYFRFLLPHLERQYLGPVLGVALADPEQYCKAESSGLIQQIADDYTERLLELGHNQLQLIGYSLGGLIAVEVARRLLEKGISLSDLVLIDSYPVFFDIEDDLLLEALFLEHFHITLAELGFEAVHPDDLLRGCVQLIESNNHRIPKDSSVTIGGNEILDKVGNLFRKLSALNKKERFTLYVNSIAKSSGEQIPVEAADVLFKVFRQSSKAARFTPSPFMGNIRLLLARDQYSFLPGMEQKILEFWRETCLGELKTIGIEGNHISCVEGEQQASQVAKLIAAPLY
jgi:pyochelin synthetase